MNLISGRITAWESQLLTVLLAVIAFLGFVILPFIFFGAIAIAKGITILYAIAFLVMLSFFIALIIYTYAVFVKRLHDIGVSTILSLIYFIPIIGIISYFIVIFLPSQATDNRFGKYHTDTNIKRLLYKIE